MSKLETIIIMVEAQTNDREIWFIAETVTDEKVLSCTFCGKHNEDKSCLCLIAAPNKTFICDKCVETARDIVGVYRIEGNAAKNIMGIK